MKGDFTRFTHDPAKHYSRVLKQQGRVELDADWNEHSDIQERLDRITNKDVIGPCGVPKKSDGFKIGIGANLRGVSFIDSRRGWAVGTDATILGTEDGGVTWIIQSPPEKLWVHFHGVKFISVNKGWIVGEQAAILSTKDGGKSWIRQYPPSDVTTHLNAVEFIDERHGWVVGDAATILVTADGGETWLKQTVPAGVTANLHAVDFLCGKGWVVGDDATILITEDYGKTWEKKIAPKDVTANLYCIDVVEEQRCWVAGGAGTIVYSEDGGTTWQRHSNASAGLSALYAISFKTPSDVWTVGDHGTIFRPTLTAQRKRTQSSYTNVTAALRGVDFYDTKYGCAVGDDGTILTTTDGGTNWTKQTPPTTLVVTISKGRAYVDGILCELETDTTYLNQPDYPNPPVPSDNTLLAYLDVWQRHITALEDSTIREVALGGPDTATRIKTIWQVKLLSLGGVKLGPEPCKQTFEKWDDLTIQRSARMMVRAEPGASSDDPCIVPPRAGYRRLENQLYRVEIHTPGPVGIAKFKWSRDNGSIASSIVKIEDNVITVSNSGHDALQAFAPSQWVEVIDEKRELNGERGTLVRLINPTAETSLVFDLATVNGDPITAENFPQGQKPKVRRWDHVTNDSEIVAASDWIDLEDGVQVKFKASDSYQTGDYWLIPARTATGDIEWPKDSAGNPLQQQRKGIEHHYCRLAVLAKAGNKWTIYDCRHLFPSFTSICAEDVCFDPSHCDEKHPDAGWKEVQDVQQAIEKICDNLCNDNSGRKMLDELRADGIVRGSSGAMGFVVTKAKALEISYTGGIAYVAGCRFEVPAGSITDVEPSTTFQILLVDDQGKVKLIVKGDLPEKYAGIAIISTLSGEIQRIIDARFDLTHLDEKVESNRVETSTKRPDRRQFVPLLMPTCLNQRPRDGRNYYFNTPAPTDIVFDGRAIWVANPLVSNSAKATVIRIDRNATDPYSSESITVPSPTLNSAYDGKYVWFTCIDKKVILINTETFEQKLLTLDDNPQTIAFDGDFIWVGNSESGTVTIIDVETCQEIRTIALGIATGTIKRATAFAFDGLYMWVGCRPGSLYRIEKPWGDLEPMPLESAESIIDLAFDGSHIWLTQRTMLGSSGAVTKFDVYTRAVTVLSNDQFPNSHELVFDGSHMWLLGIGGEQKAFGTMHKVDVDTNVSLGTIKLAEGYPSNGVFDGTHLWHICNPFKGEKVEHQVRKMLVV